MKRKAAVLMLALSLALTAAGCGSDSGAKKEETTKSGSEESEDSSEIIDKDAISKVKLGEYKNLEVELEGEYDTDEDALNDYIDSLVSDGYEKDKKKKVVEKDSIVNINYVGKKDGVAFAGGSADNVMVDVANNMDAESGTGYIDGFTDGLVGAKVGDKVDCPVTFPENYGAEDLAGADVIFTFTVNYIAKPSGMDHSNLTDEYVNEKFGFETVDAFRDSKLEELKQQNESGRSSELRSVVIQTVVDNAKIEELPEGLLEKRLEDYKVQFESMYVPDGQTIEDYLSSTYNIGMDEFEEESRGTLKQTIERELIFLAVADAEGMEINEEEYNTYVNNLVASAGVSTKEDLYAQFGATKEDGKKYLKQVYLCNKAVDLCVDSASEKE